MTRAGRSGSIGVMRLLPLTLCLMTLGCDSIRALVIKHYPLEYAPEGGHTAAIASNFKSPWPDNAPRFAELDLSREQVDINLTPVLAGLSEPTDLSFFPGSDSRGYALEKGGRLALFDLKDGALTEVTSIAVPTRSEQGLLGIALHPSFKETGRFYLHTSADIDGTKHGEFTAWTASKDRSSVTRDQTILSIEQPYGNHNGGKIAFGPDGFLYLGLGDGGWRDDPHKHGQNGQTWLGSILRIDVDSPAEGAAYSVPKDNPWVSDPEVADEAWAIGLRNPWKFSFTPDGRMIVADVGQNAFEEVSMVQAGDNLGWAVREGRHCFPEKTDCSSDGLVEPIFEYPHKMGQSITGGFVTRSSSVPAIKDHYVFADFVSGRIWAIPVPETADGPMVEAKALGQWPFLPSTFAEDSSSRLYVAGYGDGGLYRIDPAGSGSD